MCFRYVEFMNVFSDYNWHGHDKYFCWYVPKYVDATNADVCVLSYLFCAIMNRYFHECLRRSGQIEGTTGKGKEK